MKQDAESIIEFADSNINFDKAQMQALYTAVGSGDEQTITTAILEAKQSALKLVAEEGGYKEFCNYLKYKKCWKTNAENCYKHQKMESGYMIYGGC